VRGRGVLGSSALLAAFATIGATAPVGSVGKGGVVQIFTKYLTQETITDREKVMEVRQVGGKQLQEFMQSGKVRASGVFADARGASLFWRSIRQRRSSTCLLRYSTTSASKPIRSQRLRS
jgi:hypothetical protein